MKPFPLWLLYGCVTVAVLLLGTGLLLYLQEVSAPDYYWHQRFYEANHSDAWLIKCPAEEVRMEWSQEEGWIDNLTIDLQAKTISGGSGNGISCSAPFVLVMAPEKPQGPTLTDDQVAQIKDALDHLPPGEARLAEMPDFSHDLRLAFYRNGAVQVRHYPGNNMPPALVKLGKTLDLQFPQQKPL